MMLGIHVCNGISIAINTVFRISICISTYIVCLGGRVFEESKHGLLLDVDVD